MLLCNATARFSAVNYGAGNGPTSAVGDNGDGRSDIAAVTSHQQQRERTPGAPGATNALSISNGSGTATSSPVGIDWAPPAVHLSQRGKWWRLRQHRYLDPLSVVGLGIRTAATAA